MKKNQDEINKPGISEVYSGVMPALHDIIRLSSYINILVEEDWD
jgi:hypothetical protein